MFKTFEVFLAFMVPRAVPRGCPFDDRFDQATPVPKWLLMLESKQTAPCTYTCNLGRMTP